VGISVSQRVRQGKLDEYKKIAFYLPVFTPIFMKFAQEFMVQTARIYDQISLGTRGSVDGGPYEGELEWLMLHQERGCKKLIRFPNQVRTEEEIRKEIESLDFDPVIILNDFWFDGGQFHSVRVDEVYGVKLVLNHLMELGHTRIMYVDCSYETRTRCLETLQKIWPKKTKGKLTTYLRSSFGLESLENSLEVIEREKITAIFTPYDEFAIRIIMALRKNKKKVPEDISVVGFDDAPGAEEEGLTTVRFPVKAIIKTALEILLSSRRHRRPVKVSIKPELVVRNSTKAVN